MSLEHALQVGSVSMAGRKPVNQDACASRVTADVALISIADGVSACQHPSEASQIAVTQMHAEFFKIMDVHQFDALRITEASEAGVHAANEALYFAELPGTELHGHANAMLSTLAALVVTRRRARVITVGDSRVYRFHQNRLHQLSLDQRDSEGRLNCLLGQQNQVRARFKDQLLTPGEISLLCTDGVHDYLADEDIAAFLAHLCAQTINQQQLERAAQRICDAAMQAGSRDNLTCTLVWVGEDALGSAIQKRGLRVPDTLHEGDMLDHYRMDHEMSCSPRSQVFSATDTHTGKRRVIKILSERFSDDAEDINAFLREERIGLRLSEVSAAFRFYPRPAGTEFLYHVSEFLEGQTIRAYIEQHAPVSPEVCERLMRKIVASVRMLHRHHILHQDLKPENLILTPVGAIKVIDFGSADSLVLRQALRAPKGALEYTAPEYYYRGKIDIQSDLFSLGVIAYELMTAKLPFDHKELMSSPRDYWIRPATRANPNLPGWVDAVFERALASELSMRYASMSEFLLDLDPAQHEKPKFKPLLERESTAVWKGVSALLVITQLLTLVLWLS